MRRLQHSSQEKVIQEKGEGSPIERRMAALKETIESVKKVHDETLFKSGTRRL